jgi:DNA repair protein RecO (recombination protein O)
VSRAQRSAAILLRSVDYGDADRIVTLLTDLHGKVVLFARGARKSRHRFAGALEPFGLIDAELALSSGEVGRLASARLARGFPRLLGSLARMQIAGAALELVRELAPPREPDPRFVPEIVALFERLDEPEEPGDEVRIAFELRWLALAGLSPRLDACGRCGREAGDRAALFDPSLGALVCRACGGGPIHLGGATRARMIASQRDGWVEASRRWTERERSEAREALEKFVRRQIGCARRGAAAATAERA